MNSIAKGFLVDAPYLSSAPGTSHGLELKGAYWFLPFALFTQLFNVAGEELIWRGVVLPRQEAHFGKYAFIVNGLLWTAFIAHLAINLVGAAEYFPSIFT